ncbi:MAG: extracellular solute-binding protein [Oscillospiraceae bacterium]|nr:extracellular solute-binding protein [Oscillospiraceae bacterium]
MRKISVLLLIATLVTVFAGCSNSSAEPTTEPSETPTAAQSPSPSNAPTESPAPTQFVREEVSEDGKRVFYIGAFSSGSDELADAYHWLENAVQSFRATNKDYEARIIDYGDASVSESTYRLNSEIIAGQAPDMFLTFGMPVERFAELGVLYDMSDWFNPEEYFTGPLEAMKTDGKLYEVSPGITLTTFYGLSSNIGTSGEMSLDDLYAEWERFNVNGDKAFIMGLTNKQICLALASTAELQFVDKSSATCNFDSPEFIKILEFCAKLPAEAALTRIEKDPSYGNSLPLYYTNALSKYPEVQSHVGVKENDSLLGVFSTAMSRAHGTILFYHKLMKGLFHGESVTYVGIPGANATSFNLEFPVAVSANSPNLEGARQFIDKLWSLSFMSFGGGDLRMIPLKREILEKEIKKDTQNAKELLSLLEYDKEIIDDAVGTLSPPEIAPYMKSDLAEFLKLIEEASLPIHAPTRQYGDEDFWNVNKIIAEEIQAFFGGTQDAKRTAELIQSRYSIYLAEQN